MIGPVLALIPIALNLIQAAGRAHARDSERKQWVMGRLREMGFDAQLDDSALGDFVDHLWLATATEVPSPAERRGLCPSCLRYQCTWFLTGTCAIGALSPEMVVYYCRALNVTKPRKDGYFYVGAPGDFGSVRMAIWGGIPARAMPQAVKFAEKVGCDLLEARISQRLGGIAFCAADDADAWLADIEKGQPCPTCDGARPSCPVCNAKPTRKRDPVPAGCETCAGCPDCLVEVR